MRLALTSILIVLGVATVAPAATISVTTTTDDTTVNGNCTLREAVIAANTDTAVDACTAGSGADVIAVPAGTYVLTLVGANEDAAATGDLDVTADVQINGAGAGSTIIDGNGADRVFDIDPAGSGLTAAIVGLTIRNGAPPIAPTSQGGGVRNGATLTLSSSAISNNTASASAPSAVAQADGGGIYSEGTLTVDDSTVSGNVVHVVSGIVVIGQTTATATGGGISGTGFIHLHRSTISTNTIGSLAISASQFGGGIYATGNIDLTDSTVSDNTMTPPSASGLTAGGGIDCVGNLTLTRSTISGNEAQFTSMAAQAPAFGGGVFLSSGSGVITNCTFSNNGALFGGAISGTALTFANSTIAGNSDGILADSGTPPVLRNTIVADNGINCLDDTTLGPLTTASNAYNLSDDTSCGFSGTDLIVADVQLGPLQNNGGPTFTRAPLGSSPAVDAANPAVPGSGGNACEAGDQRSLARPAGPRCDIGAVELGAGAAVCGDGFIGGSELCDDGNTTSGDGCSATCQVEACYSCSGLPSECTPISPCLDHYKCYNVRDLKQPKFTTLTVDLADQFGTENGVRVIKPAYLCNPVDVNGQGIQDSVDHLMCYKIRGAKNGVTVQTNNELGQLRLQTKAAKLICTPASKTVIP